jgi:hypothetical protein
LAVKRETDDHPMTSPRSPRLIKGGIVLVNPTTGAVVRDRFERAGP